MASHHVMDECAAVARAVFLSAVGILAVAAGNLSAQDISEPLEGVVCQPPQCDIRRSLPIGVQVPLEATAALVQLVQSTLASALDRNLPPVTIDQWLFGTLSPHVEIVRSNLVDWSLTLCDERRSAIPRAGPDLCVDATVPLSAKKVVKILVDVAEGKSATDGRTGWRPHEPSIRDLYIERLGENGSSVDSLDVPTLSDLEKQIRLPIEKWPSVDLRSAVTWTPERWAPGDVVRFSIWVENHGDRDLDRAWVRVLIAAPSDGDEGIQIHRDWFPAVPAGKRMAFEISVRLPRGDAIVSVHVSRDAGAKKGRASNVDGDTTVVLGLELVPGYVP